MRRYTHYQRQTPTKSRDGVQEGLKSILRACCGVGAIRVALHPISAFIRQPRAKEGHILAVAQNCDSAQWDFRSVTERGGEVVVVRGGVSYEYTLLVTSIIYILVTSY